MSLDHIGIDLQLGWFRNLMNGWKRTLASVAQDIQWSSDDMKRIFQGKTDIEELQALAVAMSRVYPTTLEKLLLPSDDTRNGLLIMRAQDSQAPIDFIWMRATAPGRKSSCCTSICGPNIYNRRICPPCFRAPASPQRISWMKPDRFLRKNERSWQKNYISNRRTCWYRNTMKRPRCPFSAMIRR